MATRPCLSGVISTAPEKNERAAWRSVAPRARASCSLRGDPLELLDRVHGQASVECSRHHRTPLELVTKPGREDHPALRVEGVLVLPQEHGPRTTCTVPVWGYPSPFHHQAPPYDTIHHSVNPCSPFPPRADAERAHNPEEEPCRCGSAEAAYRNAPGNPTTDRDDDRGVGDGPSATDAPPSRTDSTATATAPRCSPRRDAPTSSTASGRRRVQLGTTARSTRCAPRPRPRATQSRAVARRRVADRPLARSDRRRRTTRPRRVLATPARVVSCSTRRAAETAALDCSASRPTKDSPPSTNHRAARTTPRGIRRDHRAHSRAARPSSASIRSTIRCEAASDFLTTHEARARDRTRPRAASPTPATAETGRGRAPRHHARRRCVERPLPPTPTTQPPTRRRTPTVTPTGRSRHAAVPRSRRRRREPRRRRRP